MTCNCDHEYFWHTIGGVCKKNGCKCGHREPPPEESPDAD